MPAPPFLSVLEQDNARLNAMLANLQAMANHRSRRDLARMLAQISNELLPRRFTRPASETALRLSQEGCLSVGRILSPGQITEIMAHFRQKRLHRAHVFSGGDATGVDFDTAAATLSHAGYALPDVIDAPHLLELANSDAILELVEQYLGCRPTLYSLNAFWSFPGSHPLRADLQRLHRDRDDFRFCTLFILLTDAAADDGRHLYLKFSHDPDILKARLAALNFSGDIDALFAPRSDLDELLAGMLDELGAPFFGPAGSAALEDTFGLHRGDKPRTPRLLFWARYGLFANKTYHVDGRALGGVDPRHYAGRVSLEDEYYLYVNRLLLRRSATG